jgi:acyl carrier protein
MVDEKQIRQFVEGLLHGKGDFEPFGDSESLILSGRLASLDAVEIVMFLECRFGLDFAEIGFDQAQIDSVQLIQALVQAFART